MEKTGRVARTDGASAVVEIDSEGGGCGRCDLPGGCRSGILTQMFRKPCREFSVTNDIGAQEGDRVLVSIEHGTLSVLSLIVYGLPVISMLVGAFLGQRFASNPIGSEDQLAPILCGLIGLFVGVAVAFCLVHLSSSAARPRLTRL